MQKRGPESFEPVFSSNFYLACRDFASHQKDTLPDIDMSYSDSEALAKQRSQLAEDAISLVREANPLDVYARPPSQSEFNLI